MVEKNILPCNVQNHCMDVKKLAVKKVGSKFYIYAYTAEERAWVVGRYATFERAKQAVNNIGNLARSSQKMED